MTLTFDFTGRAVLVTGATRGIGHGIASLFAKAGARVAVLDLDPAALEETWGTRTDTIAPIAVDVADPEAVAAAVDDVVRWAGSVDVAVNNAGITRDGVVWKLTDAAWAQVLDVHLGGTFHVTRAVVPHMRAAGFGRIVNVGQANYAAAGRVRQLRVRAACGVQVVSRKAPPAAHTGYSQGRQRREGPPGRRELGPSIAGPSMAGIIGFTKTVAKEVARFGITVNAVSPNAATAVVAGVPEAKLAELTAAIPMSRFADPAEMAPAVAFLASAEAGYMTGTVLPVDGGMSM